MWRAFPLVGLLVAAAACGGGGASKGDRSAAGLPPGAAPVGESLPVARPDASWQTIEAPGEAGLLRVPPTWSVERPGAGDVVLRPPGESPALVGPLIALVFHPGAPYAADGAVPAHQTRPVAVSVAGIAGRAYADAEPAVPHYGYTIELPYRGGLLEIFAVSGPVTNLVPQLGVLLETLTLP